MHEPCIAAGGLPWEYGGAISWALRNCPRQLAFFPEECGTRKQISSICWEFRLEVANIVVASKIIIGGGWNISEIRGGSNATESYTGFDHVGKRSVTAIQGPMARLAASNLSR